MKPALDKLRENVAVADGGWSTQLVARGFPHDVPPENANVAAAGLVAALAQAFVQAGAEFLTTNTFAANRLAAKRRGITHDLHELNVAAAQIARSAAGQAALVAGSIGPSGGIIAIDEHAEEELLAAFGEQARALAAGGVELIVLESFTELSEALIALRAAKEATKLPVFASMTFDSGPQRTHTMMGAGAGECAAALADNGADAVGCDCGAGIHTALPAIVAMRSKTDLPLWIKPAAGPPDLEEGRPVYNHTPEEFAEPVTTLLEAGANIIGGCCGVGPAHIQRVAAIVRHWRGRGQRGA